MNKIGKATGIVSMMLGFGVYVDTLEIQPVQAKIDATKK